MRALLVALLFCGAASAEVVAARPVPRGGVVTAADIEGGSEAERNALLGLVAQRPLMPGRAIRTQYVRAPHAVERQGAVTVLFRRGALKLSTEGRAIGAGSIGETVDVSLRGRRQPISGRVVAPGVVEVEG